MSLSHVFGIIQRLLNNNVHDCQEVHQLVLSILGVALLDIARPITELEPPLSNFQVL